MASKPIRSNVTIPTTSFSQVFGEMKGAFHSTKISVWNFRNSTCPLVAFRLHRPNPSHRALGYCSFKQGTKERYWGQQFCQMERNISVRPTEMTRPVKEDHLQSWSRIFRSDQTEMVRSIWCTNRNFRNFGLNGKQPMTSSTNFQYLKT